MKKIISSILIAIVILQIFAPFSVGFENKKLEINVNKSEAADNSIKITSTVTNTDTSITVTVRSVWGNNGFLTGTSGVVVSLSDSTGKILQTELIDLHTVDKNPLDSLEVVADTVKEGTTSGFKELEPNTLYGINIVGSQDIVTWTSILKNSIKSGLSLGATILQLPESSINQTTMSDPAILKVTTNKKNDQTTTEAGKQISVNEDTILPDCDILYSSTWGGCIGKVIYWGIFKPTSKIFALSGKLLDISINYSTKDTSYRSAFVIEGWGIVRDFCNMFFIFILLYVAIGTILNLHSVKTKEMIINVVIIGLLMNFSLFTTQVIIDTSNILTRVFYNSNSIQIGKKGSDGKVQAELGSQDELKLSEAIVSKINPQTLIIQSSQADNIQTKLNAGSETKDAAGVSPTTFILVSILSSIVNIVGSIVFVSSSLIFITRVIGLWLAMILVPLAFFSYTTPLLKGIKTIGWAHWWPETLKLAFLAPIFVFFIYLIVMFLETGLNLFNIKNTASNGMDFILGVFIPFIFIMALLWKAKSIANDMSGEIGQSITNGIKTVGGIALGAAAGGTALLGRQIIGKGMAAMSRSDSATHLATQKFAYNKEVEKWKKDGKKGDKPIYNAPKTGDVIVGKDGKETTYKKNPFTYFGGKLNEKQMKVGGIDHARHEEDEVMKASGLEGRDRATLSGQEIKTMEGKFKQMKGSDAEAAARKGMDAKGDKILLDGIEGGENAFKAAKRREVAEEILDKAEDGDVIEETKKVTSKKFNPDTKLYEDVEEEVKTGKKVLSRQGEKKLEDKLNIALSVAVKDAAAKKLIKDFEHMRTDANKHVNPLTRGFAGSNKHSYDIRKLSEMKTDRREGILTKGTVGLVAAVAAGVRGGIKGVGMGNGGVKVEGDFLKDLGSTISDSLKSMKVNVNLSHVGEHKSSADAHGGGGHH